MIRANQAASAGFPAPRGLGVPGAKGPARRPAKPHPPRRIRGQGAFASYADCPPARMAIRRGRYHQGHVHPDPDFHDHGGGGRAHGH